VDEFANMSDEELRQYVYGTKELDSWAMLALSVTHPVPQADALRRMLFALLRGLEPT
jgi:hypothetical protein